MTKLFCSWCCHFFSRLHNWNVENDKTFNGVKQNKLLHETKKRIVLIQHENKVSVLTNLLVRFVVIQLWFLSLVLRREVLHHLLESIFTPMKYDLVLRQFLHNTRRQTLNHNAIRNVEHSAYCIFAMLCYLLPGLGIVLDLVKVREDVQLRLHFGNLLLELFRLVHDLRLQLLDLLKVGLQLGALYHHGSRHTNQSKHIYM